MHVCTWGHMLAMGLQVHQKVTTDIEEIETELVSCLNGRCWHHDLYPNVNNMLLTFLLLTRHYSNPETH